MRDGVFALLLLPLSILLWPYFLWVMLVHERRWRRFTLGALHVRSCEPVDDRLQIVLSDGRLGPTLRSSDVRDIEWVRFEDHHNGFAQTDELHCLELLTSNDRVVLRGDSPQALEPLLTLAAQRGVEPRRLRSSSGCALLLGALGWLGLAIAVAAYSRHGN